MRTICLYYTLVKIFIQLGSKTAKFNHFTITFPFDTVADSLIDHSLALHNLKTGECDDQSQGHAKQIITGKFKTLRDRKAIDLLSHY